MIRILHILSSLRQNGTESFVMNVFRNLNRKEIDFDFLIFEDYKEGFYDEIISKGSDVYFLTPRRNGIRKYQKSLDTFFKTNSEKYAAVHFHCTSLTTIAPLIFAKKYGIKKRIVHLHGSGCRGFHNHLFHYFNKYKVSKYANYFLGCSENAIDWGYGGRKFFGKSQVITNGIIKDNYRFNPQHRSAFRKQFGIEDYELLVSHVGMLHPLKNHKFLIDVIERLHKNDCKVKLICAGIGQTYDSLAKDVTERGLKEYICFTGYMDDVEPLLSASDLFVFPSIQEGFGFAVLEAQINGVPVISSKSIPKEIKISDNVYFIDLKEGAQKWAEKILEVSKINLSRKSLENVDKYSIDKTVQELTTIYKA